MALEDELPSATNILFENGININEMGPDEFNCNILNAMERYAEAYHAVMVKFQSAVNHSKNDQKEKIINPFFEDSGASFSNDRKHRYSLWRIWDRDKPLVMFIGLNPSTANENDNDPTIKSVCRIAKHNGYGGVYMMNCWTYVSTDPAGIMTNPMADQQNANLITVIASKCKDVVFAWGNFPIVKQRGKDVELQQMFPRALVLKLNKNGSPLHPLYCKSTTQLISWKEK